MSGIGDAKKAIETWIADNREPFEAIALDIWAHPELSLHETNSSQLLEDILAKHGFAVEAGVAGMPTAFIATYGQGKPVIGINAEYDCLPGLSQEAGKSEHTPLIQGAPGHGCGHNLLGTAGVLGAIALRHAMEAQGLSGTIKVFGSPAEELCIGKPFMAREGCYANVDCFLDWHPWNYNRADYDTCSAYFNIKYRFHGKTSHGNMPWNGASALDGAVLMAHAIEMLREHIPSAPEDAANTINYTFSDTGPAFPSVVPDHAELWCIGRMQTSELLHSVMERLENCAQGCAKATGVTCDSELITASHEKIPNIALSHVMYDNFTALGTPAYTEEEHALARAMQKGAGLAEDGIDAVIKEFGTSGTALCDTSEYSWCAPYATFWLAIAPAGGWHNWMVTSMAGSSVGLKAMEKAAAIIACSALDVLDDPAILQAAQKEWKERLQGRTFETLLPDGAKVPEGII